MYICGIILNYGLFKIGIFEYDRRIFIKYKVFIFLYVLFNKVFFVSLFNFLVVIFVAKRIVFCLR